MKKVNFIFLLVPALVAISASGCSNGEKLKLFDANSRFIGSQKVDRANPNVKPPETFENLHIAPLATYHLNGKGDVPYVELSQLTDAMDNALQSLVTKGLSYEIKDDGFHLYSVGKKGELVLDDKTDIVKLKNGPSFGDPINISNNSIAGDYCSFRGNSIKESEKTRVYKEDGSAVQEYETYSFKDYGFDIYKKDNKYYAPFEAVTKLIYRDVGFDCSYNGSEFYVSTLGSFTSSLIKSSKGYWSAYSGIYAPDKVENGEAYRFHFTFERFKEGSDTEKEVVTKFLVLYDNEEKTGSVVLCPGETYNPASSLQDIEATYSYRWRKDGDVLYINVKDDKGEVLGEYGIHLNETRFTKSTISKEMSEYNYNILRFMFDNFYGLKGIKGYKDAEEYFNTCDVKAGLKSTNAKEYNTALAKLFGKVDDGHSGHSGLSLYTAYDDLDALPALAKANAGPRLKALAEKKKTYNKARIDKYGELHPEQAGNADPNFYHGIQFSSDNQTAVLTFDAFTHEAEQILNMKEKYPTGEVEQYLVRSNFISSTPDGFSAAFTLLKNMNKNSKVVKNVVIDLTNNGGGLIATMPYVTAFFSDDPTFTLKDTINGTIREYHYKVDLNGDGVFGGQGDTFKNDFNFFMLTSGFSFSCGNCLPGIAKNNGVKIIGERSGGGVSPVGVFMDAYGSNLTLSDYFNMAYKDANGKYVQNDDGIPLDYEFPLQNGNWYDPNAIQTFIKSISN